jgi:translation initiation factor 2B subunit (eIF-2B alpha/beta/delta family)
MTDARETTHVVTVFLRHDTEVLLLRRSDAVGSYSGRWGGVAGHCERETRPEAPAGNDGGWGKRAESWDPPAAARAEIREETGLDPDQETTHIRRGDPFDVTDPDLGTRWVVHPSLFAAARRDVTTNYETAEHEWVSPTAILRRATVPNLWSSYDRVRPTVETVADDREHGSASLSLRAQEVLRDEAGFAAERDAGGWDDLATTARTLGKVRASMPVVANRVNRVMAAAVGDGTDRPSPGAVERAAMAELDRALAADERAAARAADLLPDRIATLSRSGTVRAALERADPSFVLVAESRPGREGVQTAERLAGTAATVTVTTDAAFGEQLAAMDVEALVVGADAVLPDGRVRNKVGTRGAACVASSECAVYVVTASDKVAPEPVLEREERDASEVYDGDAEVEVANPTFGVTPADAVDAVITEDGVLETADITAVAETHRERSRWPVSETGG